MGKLNTESRPLPYWIRIKTNRNVTSNPKGARNWRRKKKVHKIIKKREKELNG